MKNLLVLLLSIIFNTMTSCVSQEAINPVETFGNGKPLNKSNNPKIGVEFEINQLFFKIETEKTGIFSKKKSLSYFNTGEKVYDHKNGLFSIDADSNYTHGYSDFEINTKPLDLTKKGIGDLEMACKAIDHIFRTINVANFSPKGKFGNWLIRLKARAVDSGTFGSEMLDVLRSSYKNSTLKIDEKLGFITNKSSKSRAYLLLKEDTIRYTPQLTFPLTNEAIYRILVKISENKLRNLLLNSNDQITASVLNFINKINDTKHTNRVLGEMSNNIELKGFLALLYINLESLMNTHSKINLKNNTPIIKARNDFGLLFKILPKELKDYLKENNAEKLLEIIAYLFPSTSLESNLFQREITLKYLRQKRLIAQELTIKKWLVEITKNNDLLVKDNYLKEFHNTPKEETDELGYAGFGDFGNKTEFINGKACGIFEWRVHPHFDLIDASGLDYIMRMAHFVYQVNEIQE